MVLRSLLQATKVSVQVPFYTVVMPLNPLMILLACFTVESPVISTASSDIMDTVAPQSYSIFSRKHCPSFSAATICRHLRTDFGSLTQPGNALTISTSSF